VYNHEQEGSKLVDILPLLSFLLFLQLENSAENITLHVLFQFSANHVTAGAVLIMPEV
jgi:hypothetical protein